MTKNELSFEEWFELLCLRIYNNTGGVVFRDSDSVKQDYENGDSWEHIAKVIHKEYGS